MLINVKSRFVWLTVVVVEKEFVLFKLNDGLWSLLCRMQGACAVLYLHLRIVSFCRIFYVISNKRRFRIH